MVYAEAADHTHGDEVITAMVDISKCFDRVDWNRVVEAAHRFGFPRGLLRAVLSMYAAPRRIRWGSTYSFAARAMQGVLPGCSVAMFLLQL
eukprot:796339-Pyramimonas_sp.AAC.1